MKTRFFDHKLKAIAAQWAGSRRRALCVTALIAALVCAGTVAANFSFVLKWGGFGMGDGQFNPPTGVAVSSTGNVYIVDQGNHRIQKFDSNGSFLTKWGTIAPAGARLIVQAEVPNKDMAFVRKGLPVKLKFDAFPFQDYGSVRFSRTDSSAGATWIRRSTNSITPDLNLKRRASPSESPRPG